MSPHLDYIRSKLHGFPAFISFWAILLVLMARSVFSGNRSAIEYYPLDIGNEWQYKHTYFTKEMVGPDTSRILISSQAEKGKDVSEFRSENGTVFMYRTKDGIMSASGFLIIKDPLNQGEQWSSGIYNYDQRRHRVESVGLSVVVQEKKYQDCIRIISQSDFHPFWRDEQTASLSFESKDVYCPQVGPVIMETFEVAQRGTRKLISRSELISFRKSQSAKGELRKEEKGFKLIEVNESFRFPERGFYHPSLSPDDKWLIYHHSPRQDDSKHPDLVWNQLFYSELTKSEKRWVPLSGPDENYTFEKVGDHVEWSNDAEALALSARKDGSDHIILVDFSGVTPRFLESFKAEIKSFQWIDRSLLYIDEQSRLMKKIPNKYPEDILNFGSSSIKMGIDSFRCAKNGTLLFRSGAKIFKSDLNHPESRSMIHEGSALLDFELSATGRFAFFLNTDHQSSMAPNATLHDLKTNKIYHLPVPVKKALFSRDGRRLAYIEKSFHPSQPSKNERKNPHFFILDTSNMEVRDYGFQISDYFGWAPEGNLIIYSMKCTHPSRGSYENGIFVIQVSDGKEIAKLTSINAAASPVISLSGKVILWEGMDMDTFFAVKNPLQ